MAAPDSCVQFSAPTDFGTSTRGASSIALAGKSLVRGIGAALIEAGDTDLG
jgi:hypothetical protein